MHFWWERKMVQTVWGFLKKLKIELPCDPPLPLTILPEKLKLGFQRDSELA